MSIDAGVCEVCPAASTFACGLFMWVVLGFMSLMLLSLHCFARVFGRAFEAIDVSSSLERASPWSRFLFNPAP